MPSSAKSGKAFGDFNGYELVLSAKETDLMQIVTSSLIPSLIVPGV